MTERLAHVSVDKNWPLLVRVKKDASQHFLNPDEPFKKMRASKSVLCTVLIRSKAVHRTENFFDLNDQILFQEEQCILWTQVN